MPELTVSQARLLAWWSYAIALTGSCGRLTVATFLALVCQVKVANVEQRLYEWCLDAADKGGERRQELDVDICQVSLLRWIVRLWVGTRLALTLDATNLGERFVVLAISVAYRGIGIPVAWAVLPATRKGAWREEWGRLLRLLHRAVPPDWTVIVLADRGLSSSNLYRQIQDLHWHPFLRINSTAKFQPQGRGDKQNRWCWLLELLGPPPALRPAVASSVAPSCRSISRQSVSCHQWQGTGRCFRDRASCIDCTLLAWWGEPYDEPWFVLTDLPPSDCSVTWYGLRAWCEQGFKCNKRGGWQWQLTRMHHPRRAARLWLALALATFWTVAVGSDLESGTYLQDPQLPDWRTLLCLPAPPTPKHPSQFSRPRRPGRPGRPIRLLRLGRLWILAQAIAHRILPLPLTLQPEPWPLPPPKPKRRRSRSLTPDLEHL
jgi:hypothetical protein